MTVYSMILTNTGLSKIADAIFTGTQINLTQIVVGDSNGVYYEPSANQTALVHEVHRLNINNKSIDPQNNSKIIIEGIIPASIGGFSIREIGIFDNTGSLIAVGKFPLIEKPDPASDSAIDLYIKEYLVISNSTVFNITVDPNIATASLHYVDDKISIHDNDNNTHQDRWILKTEAVTTPAANKILKLDSNSKLPANITGNADGNAATATKLQTARTISITGDTTGSVSFDGSTNVSISSTLANSGITVGTYKSITVDAKGRVTAGSNPTTLSGYGITDAINTSDVVSIATANKVLKLDANSKLPASITGNSDGNAATATKLQTARTISLTGDITGSVSFDGSVNASITSTLSNSGITAGTYKSVTVDAKGRITAGSNPTTLSGYGITDGVNTSDIVTTPAANKILRLNASSKFPANITGNADGNAATATKLQTARTISLAGDVTGSISFDGSTNASITSTLANSGITAGTYKSVTVDAKGRITAGANPTTLSGYGITDAVNSSEIVTTATANKILKLNSSAKLPASITGDADTLDGFHSSAFALADHTHPSQFSQLLNSNGYTKLPNGLVMQWGRVINGLARGGTYDVYFPTVFPNTLWQVQATVIAANPNNGILALQTLNYYTNKFSIQIFDQDSNLTDFVWFALGC